MSDQVEQYEKSWILYHVLDRFIGSREIVTRARKKWDSYERVRNHGRSRAFIFTGSTVDGLNMAGSDTDMMLIDENVIVLCHDGETSYTTDNAMKSVFVMRNACSRSGYVNLELAHRSQRVSKLIFDCIVPIGNEYFLSSEMFNRAQNERFSHKYKINFNTNGPASSLQNEHIYHGRDMDVVVSLPCYTWPKEAEEWVTRPRCGRWPDKPLSDQIVQDGCHLVPVGDKTSSEPFMQWRISFVSAEKKLVHSLTHIQFLIYGLLKYFLKQISEMLKRLLGDTDILSSYIMKTIIFYAVETTHDSLWQEKHTFLCFMFCLNMLISWVNAGYCPNYFINRNNMFLGKVNDENKTKLLHFLIDLRDMTWGCLSVGTFIQPSIGDYMESIQNGTWELIEPSKTQLEREYDMESIIQAFSFPSTTNVLPVLLPLMSTSTSSDDEFHGFVGVTRAICNSEMETFGKHTTVNGNKQKYKYLRKCRRLLTPCSAICASPGLLTLATYYYQTGNYAKTLKICGNLISSNKIYVGYGSKLDSYDRYEDLFCGRGYTLQQKCQKGIISDMALSSRSRQFWPPQLHLEVVKADSALPIPPIPYALFLSFLCYQELDDTRSRDAALTQLHTVKYNEEQGTGKHWIVHNLLGICYETIGDTNRALREYRDSLGVQTVFQYDNPAKERIERLQQ
ncbi:uncharacterized protein LOC132549448 [Ylistrum balloti]|uniref:uncharacterized protein LOC132549448 n=1 Tax=Ylistrum balloti TaxID=509963 RepID=UPI002905E848|nr:uncharacterized protein LOC132549448 [Ylistrum balloti]XP_060069376.1 uncharacterized protein LOC132549448 [Ylistrum balloti]